MRIAVISLVVVNTAVATVPDESIAIGAAAARYSIMV
jgi:hypothetical protein